MSTDMTKIKEEYAQLQEEMKAVKKKIRVKSENMLTSACKEMFDACPDVLQLHWAQYTPWFNDGEECTFGTTDVCFLLKCDLDEDGAFEDFPYEGSRLPSESVLKSAWNDIQDAAKYETDPEAWRRERFGAKYDEALQAYNSTGRAYVRNSYVLTYTPSYESVAEAEEYYNRYKVTYDNMTANDNEQANLLDEVMNFISDIPDEIKQEMFGNHVTVLINRDGVEVDEFEHD